jgi:hypothetical protein
MKKPAQQPEVVSLIDFAQAPALGTRYWRPAPSGASVGRLRNVVTIPGGPWLVWEMTCFACGDRWREWSPLRQPTPLPSHCPVCRPGALRRAGRRVYASPASNPTGEF